MDELTPDDVARLVGELKSGGLYDAVFIDMPSGLNKRAAAILKGSDVTVRVLSAA